MRHAWTAAAFLALTPAVRAADDAYPLEVKVGESLSICATGTIQCPAGNGICDDLKVATPVGAADGLAFRGVGPGTTLCSAASAGGSGARRVYRVTVTADPPAKPPPARR